MLTKDAFDTLLSERGTLIIDGALATELENRGYDLNHPLWSAKLLTENPDIIQKVHLDYYLAGADIAITASYQASLQGFEEHFGIDSAEAMHLIRQSVELARGARNKAYRNGISPDRKLLVAGSVGPYGAYLADGSEYRGDYQTTKSEFQSFHRPRIQALIDGGVDLLAIETMPNLKEVEAVLDLLCGEFPHVTCWLSCTLRDPQHLSDGTRIETLCGVLNQYFNQVVAVGINCVPHEIVLECLQYMKQYIQLPLLSYPNSGESWDANTKTWTANKPMNGDSENEARDWQAAGARLIGGCCRTGPEYIRLVAKATTSQPSHGVTWLASR